MKKPNFKRLALFFVVLLAFTQINVSAVNAQYYEGDGCTSGCDEGPPPDEGSGEEAITLRSGGHILFTGLMELLVEKYVSTDGVNYVLSGNTPVTIPNNADTRLYYKIVVTNLGIVSAVNIKFKHTFDAGLSDMTAGGIENLDGATLSSSDNIIIDKIPVNKTAEVTYSILVHEAGLSDEMASDILKLTRFETRLPIYHIGFTLLGINSEYITKLLAQ